MSQYKHAEIGDDVYFWFAANSTSGSGDDGASPLYDVRLAGAAADAAPKASGSPTLLTHGDYGAGLHEIKIDTDGWDAGEYAVFCTITVSAVNPAGFCGSFLLRTAGTAALDVNIVSQDNIDFGALQKTTLGTAQSVDNNIILAHADYGLAKLVRSTTPANKLDVSATGEAGLDFDNIKDATGAHTLTNITVPVVTTNSDMRGTDGANTVEPDPAGTAPTTAEIQAEMEENGASILDTLRDDLADGGRLDLLIDAIKAVTDNLPDSGALSSLATAAALTTVDTVVDAIKAKTDNLPADPADDSDIDSQLSTIGGKIDIIGGYLDTEIAAILEDTGTSIPALIAALNNISVGDITGAEVDNDGSAISLAGAFKLILSALAGKSSGGGTSTIVFRDIADAKNRISATVDADGNRTAVGTRDAT